MRTSRLWRLAAACRRPLILLLLSFGFPRSVSAATLTGRVLDPDGRAVPGVRLVVAGAIGSIAERFSDTAGEFQIADLPAGRYEVRAILDGFQADPNTVALAADETRVVDVHLRLSAVAESIVVSASLVDLPLSRAADAVTVVTAADLRARQVETVADALRLLPGLAVTRSGGRGALTSLFPRGGNSNYTLVLVDGIRANSFGGGYDFAHLPVADIDRIEIVRGPQSALFGSDAIGAVVQIVTRRGGPPRVDGLIEAGGQATTRLAVGGAGSNGPWSWGAGAERTRSDGFTGVAPATGELVTNDDYRLSHVSGTLGWQRPNGADLLVAAQITRNERGFPGPFGTNPAGIFQQVDRISRGAIDERRIGSRMTYPWSPRIRQRLEVSYTDIGSDFTSPFGPSASGTRRFDGRVQNDFLLAPSLGASAGVEFLRERGSSTYITSAASLDPLPIRRSVTGVYGELRYVGGERLFITGGVRTEHITRDRLEANALSFPPRPLFPDQTVDSVNPKVAVSYVVRGRDSSGATTRLRASAGTGIRPPDAFEIAFTDNPDLTPERSRSIDAGVEQQFGGGAYTLAGTVFVNRYDDLIVTVRGALRDASRYYSDNIANARARGLELEGGARLTSSLLVRASYTFLDTGILSVDRLNRLAPPPFKVGDALIRRPRHQGAIDLTYDGERVGAFAELATRSRALDIEPNFGSSFGLFFTPGYGVVNAGASVRVGPALEVYGRLLNLADRAYEETLGYPALGRTAMIGVRLAARR